MQSGIWCLSHCLAQLRGTLPKGSQNASGKDSFHCGSNPKYRIKFFHSWFLRTVQQWESSYWILSRDLFRTERVLQGRSCVPTKAEVVLLQTGRSKSVDLLTLIPMSLNYESNTCFQLISISDPFFILHISKWTQLLPGNLSSWVTPKGLFPTCRLFIFTAPVPCLAVHPTFRDKHQQQT